MLKNYAIFINLGTPSDTRLFSIQKYLFQFLFDPCVIDIPWFSRLLLVGGIIVPFRSFRTRKSYQKIFTTQGSPLMVYSRKTVEKINALWDSGDSKNFPNPTALLAMRYGKPSLEEVFSVFHNDFHQGHDVKVVFIPLYPQAALSTTGTVIRKIKSQVAIIQKRKKQFSKKSFKYQIAPPFYQEKDYLDILADSIRPYLKSNYDHILFSYHGIPERHLQKYDLENHCLSNPNCCKENSPKATISHRNCYRHQVYVTTDKLTQKLNLPAEKYSLAFQSRLGRSPWLTPYTDQTIIQLAEQGIKRLLVVCPAFVSDNLETLFEIEIENRELFFKHGGEDLTLIPCLNDRENWIEFLKNYAEKYLPH